MNFALGFTILSEEGWLIQYPTYWSLVGDFAGVILTWLAPPLLLLCFGGSYLVRTYGAGGLWRGFLLASVGVGAALTLLATQAQGPAGELGWKFVLAVLVSAVVLLPAAVLIAILHHRFRNALALGALAGVVSVTIVLAVGPWLLLGVSCALTGNCL